MTKQASMPCAVRLGTVVKSTVIAGLIASTVLSVDWAKAERPPICLADPSGKLATAGDVVITFGDFDAFVAERVEPDRRPGFVDSAERIGRVLEALYLPELFLGRLIKEDKLDERTSARLRRSMAETAAMIYVDRAVELEALDDYSTQARELYLTRPEQFLSPRRFDFEHVFVPLDSDGTEMALLEAVLLLHELLQSGHDADEAIGKVEITTQGLIERAVFEDLSAPDLAPEIVAKLTGAEEGQWQPAVRSGRGWHFVRLLEFHEPAQLSWEEAEPLALREAERRHRERLRERILASASGAPWHFPEGAVRELLERYGLDGFTRMTPEMINEVRGQETPEH